MSTEMYGRFYCKAFDEDPREYSIMVDRDGNVLAWDSVAQHYTRAHQIGPATQAEIVDILLEDATRGSKS